MSPSPHLFAEAARGATLRPPAGSRMQISGPSFVAANRIRLLEQGITFAHVFRSGVWAAKGAGVRAGSSKMAVRRTICMVFLACACVCPVRAQETGVTPPQASGSDPVLTHRPITPPAEAPKPETVPLTVSKGTPMQVALDNEVRIRKVGQPLRGHIVQPIYAFDKLVVPVGTAVNGEITQIQPVPAGKRTLAALDANFTPPHTIEVTFNELVLADGKHIPIHTAVTPGSGQVIQFLTAADKKEKNGVKDAATEKAQQAKAQAKQEWDTAMQQVKAPGKVRKVERYAIDQLPVHPHYIDAGTLYFAELQEPLDFGAEQFTNEMAASLGAAPPPGSFVHARLVTPLSSATTPKGAEVEAILERPLFDGNHLILPQGSLLKGSVVQVQPARYMSRNGQLRMVFHELLPPEGPGGVLMAQKVDANLEGVQAGKADNVKLDAEGGAEATTPKTRYLQTGIAIGLAMASAGGDADARTSNPAGNTSNRVAGGAGGFKVVGIVLGLVVHSRAFGYSMGAYGAGMSIYVHFIARGRDVVFPKNTAMDIGIGVRPASPPKSESGASVQ